MKFKVGVEGFTIDSAHYTLSSVSNSQIHGHTYVLNVEIEGEINPENGFIIDFDLIKNIVREIVKEWDHKLIVPKQDLDKIYLKGPFRNDIKVINSPFPTAEYIGLEIAKEIYSRLNLKVTIKLYEGKDSYVIIEYP